MNEAEWLRGTDPGPLLEHLRNKESDRKLRLYAVACVRRSPPVQLTPDEIRVVEAVERHCDNDSRLPAIQDLPNPDSPVLRNLLHTTAFYAARSTAGTTTAAESAPEAEREEGRVVQCQYLRDIFGNPFRFVTFDPTWRTSTATTLARQMYETRDFSAMPILADALQDAGCGDEAVLSHCRDANQIHVRGCWVVDLLLGKR